METTDGTTDGRPMKWEELQTRSAELVGKDVESELVGGTFRGPIKRIGFDMTEGMAVVVFEWLAAFNPTVGRTGEWQMVSVPNDSSPAVTILIFSEWKLADIGDGMIRLVDRDFNRHIIFLQGWKLPLDEVVRPDRN